MKILMTWEMDSDPIHLHHLRLIGHVLREQKPGCQLILASTQALSSEDARFFDEVYITNRMQLKHSNASTGVLANLSSLGWTAPDLRQIAFSTWAQLFRAVCPDFIVAEASPGALLSAVLEDIPVIQSSHGHFQVTQGELVLNELFPEFQMWLWKLTGHTYAQLLSKPGLVFAPRSLDVKRPGMVFHVNSAQWFWEQTELEAPDALIYGAPEGLDQVSHLLAEYGYSSQIVRPGEQVNKDSVKLVLGHYDRFSVSLATAAGAVYLGSSPSAKDLDWAKRCIESKVAYQIRDEDSLAMILQGLKSGTKREGEFIDIRKALSYFI